MLFTRSISISRASPKQDLLGLSELTNVSLRILTLLLDPSLRGPAFFIPEGQTSGVAGHGAFSPRATIIVTIADPIVLHPSTWQEADKTMRVKALSQFSPFSLHLLRRGLRWRLPTQMVLTNPPALSTGHCESLHIHSPGWRSRRDSVPCEISSSSASFVQQHPIALRMFSRTFLTAQSQYLATSAFIPSQRELVPLSSLERSSAAIRIPRVQFLAGPTRRTDLSISNLRQARIPFRSQLRSIGACAVQPKLRITDSPLREILSAGSSNGLPKDAFAECADIESPRCRSVVSPADLNLHMPGAICTRERFAFTQELQW